MALHKLSHLVLSNASSPDLLCKILDDMTGRRHSPISKVIDSINKNFFLLDSKTLVLEAISFLPCLGEAFDASGNGCLRAFVVPSCIGVISILSSSNCINCGRNPG